MNLDDHHAALNFPASQVRFSPFRSISFHRGNMSLGYAEKLSFIEDVGNVGMTEFFDPPHVLQEKVERLAIMIQKCKHLVVFTGAGISTSCGIPDFRGPKGIWTLQREGKALPEASLPFHRATPSSTHMALVELEKAGILKFLISQNVDGLHLRSGMSREKLAELHGNSFMELCPSCGAEYLRDFEIETIGLKETTRRCSKAGCGSRLRDTVLDWEDALPPKEMDPSVKHCKMADLVLCLGTSLQITPACNLPLKCLRSGGKIVIVNLQKTPKDKKASLVMHGRVDMVITGVMNLLNIRIPPFVRIDFFKIIIVQALSLDKGYVNWTLRIASVHGNQAPLPFIKSAEISFPQNSNMKSAFLRSQPLQLKRRSSRSTKRFDISVKLNFSCGCKCADAELNIPVDFETHTDHSEEDKDAVIQSLKDRAIEEPCCGQTTLIEKGCILVPNSDVYVHAIVTNVVEYESCAGETEASSLSNGAAKRRNESMLGGGMSWKRTKARKHSSKPRR